jgi:hypothetical protein
VSAADLTAVLSGGSNPSGQVSFSVFGPQASPPPSCAYGGTVIDSVSAAGDRSYVPGQGFTPSTVGDYWWYANYSGDLANTAATTSCGALVHETVVQTPALRVSAPARAALGAAISPSAIPTTLSGAASAASGTVTLEVFGPEAAPPTNCASGGTQLGSMTVHGDGTLDPPSGFTAGRVGDYWWYSSYSGDGGDPAAASVCGTAMAQTIITASTTLSLSQPTATATVGAALSSPVAALTGGVGETGTVRFVVFGPQSSPPGSCATGGTAVASATVQGDGSYTAASFTPSAAGDYWWYASYSGDTANSSSASSCGAQMPVTVAADPPAQPGQSPKTSAATAALGSAARILKITTSGETMRVKLSCRARTSQSCTGGLKATTTELKAASAGHRSAERSRSSRKRTVTIATLAFKLRGGKSRQLSIRLNKLGIRLLRSRRVISAVVELHEGRSVRRRTVTMRLPK